MQEAHQIHLRRDSKEFEPKAREVVEEKHYYKAGFTA